MTLGPTFLSRARPLQDPPPKIDVADSTNGPTVPQTNDFGYLLIILDRFWVGSGSILGWLWVALRPCGARQRMGVYIYIYIFLFLSLYISILSLERFIGAAYFDAMGGILGAKIW